MPDDAPGEPRRPRVIAHRGVHDTGATENTMAAFELAVEAGADMIELDVRRTGAGELAILHDHAIGGVALASCPLSEFEQRTGFRPPLLAEVLQWARGRIGLDVELKEDGYAEQVATMLVEFGAGGGDLLVTSFLDPVLARLSRVAPELRSGLLLTLTAAHAVRRARDCGAAVLLPQMRLLSDELVGEITMAGLETVVWDFMPDEHAELLGDDRVGAVITDDVAGTLAARPRAQKR